MDWVSLLRGVFLSKSVEDRMADMISPGAEVVPIGKLTAEFSGTGYSVQAEENRKRAAIVAFIRSQLGRTYKLGVEVKPYTDSEVWDCSEIVENSYTRAGVPIPDGSNYQHDHCRPVLSPIAADLGFLYSDKWKRIGHVLVYTGEGTVIHAVGGRGVVEDPRGMWEVHTRWRGWRRHPAFSRPKEDRA